MQMKLTEAVRNIHLLYLHGVKSSVFVICLFLYKGKLYNKGTIIA